MNRERTVETLREVAELLDKHQVAFKTAVRDVGERVMTLGVLSAEDERILFGGMGSLSDVWISRRNGHAVDDEEAANAKLDRLRRRLLAAVRDEDVRGR